MKRNVTAITKRRNLVRLAINHQSKAARVVRKYAHRIERAKTTNESVNILSDLLGVSESTVFKDYSKS